MSAPAGSAPLPVCRDKKRHTKSQTQEVTKKLYKNFSGRKGRTKSQIQDVIKKKSICVLKMSSASKQGSFQDIVEAAEKTD
jgi:hypothetical protein